MSHRPKIALILILALNTLFGSLSAQRLTYGSTKIQRVTLAYSYIYIIHKDLDDMKAHFPALHKSIEHTDSVLNTHYGAAIDSVHQFIHRLATQKIIDSLHQNLDRVFLKQLDASRTTGVFTLETAGQYLNLLDSSIINGLFPSPIQETLLFYQYATHPEKECTDSYYTLFTMNHLPGLKNGMLQFKIPQSWKLEDSTRQGIARSFSSDYAQGQQACELLFIKIPLPGIRPLTDSATQADINYFLQEIHFKKIITDKSTLLCAKKILLGNKIGIRACFEHPISYHDIHSKTSNIMYLFNITGNILCAINCSVYLGEFNEAPEAEIKRFQPLFDLMAKSITIYGTEQVEE